MGGLEKARDAVVAASDGEVDGWLPLGIVGVQILFLDIRGRRQRIVQLMATNVRTARSSGEKIGKECVGNFVL